MQPHYHSNNFYQGFLFSHPALNAMQFYAIPPPPHLVYPQFPPTHPPQAMFIPPPWLPTPPIPPYFAPQTFFPPAARTPNVQQTAAAICEIPSASHGPPIAAQSPPSRASPERLAAPPSPSSNPVSGPNSDFSTSSPVVKEQSPPRFKGEAEVRVKGRREILIYRIPGSTEVYSFKVNSEKDNIKNCFCIGCLKNYCDTVKETFQKHRYKLIPFKEKEPTITVKSIMMIKRMESLGEEFKEQLIGRILQRDEERRRKRREYRQRKKAEKEAAKLLDQSNGHLAETSSSKVQRKARRSNIWYGLTVGCDCLLC
ncbi:hypothetical protein ANCDUO_00753 [Ancylostoma duodenale]|uniref:Uncharacterized protein n=1 Tax=Ancylostoma duodenale TaxID=51022 RepID=A0A0C2E0R8_9BILA|nr:hypothetical protein ANCDUO_00753 [Ancylostoma duodenale]